MNKEKKDAPIIPLIPPLGMPIDLAGPVVADPQGSYTGVPEDDTQKPVQDADDL